MKTAVEHLAETIGYPEAVRRLFEVFTASCDWWAERVKEAMTPEPVFPEMVILP